MAALDGEGDFDIAQMKILILETMEHEFRYWALRTIFNFEIRTGGVTLS
jgi:hypothetical protein